MSLRGVKGEHCLKQFYFIIIKKIFKNNFYEQDTNKKDINPIE